MTTPSDECTQCGGEGLVDFSDEEWTAMYGVPMAEYQMTGKEPETMKTCPGCNGAGSESTDHLKVILGDEVCWK